MRAIIIIPAAAALYLFANDAFAAGAYFVDDGEIVDPGQTQIESWYSHSSKNENLGVADAAYQVLPHAEFTLLNAYDSQRSGSSDALSGQVKYQWHEGGEGKIFSSSAVLGINSSPSDRQFSGLYAYIPSTFPINGKIDVNANLGWQYISNTGQNFLTWGLGAHFHVTELFSVVGEAFDETMGHPGGQLGAHFDVSKSLSFDAIYGRNITGIPANWVTAGATVTF